MVMSYEASQKHINNYLHVSMRVWMCGWPAVFRAQINDLILTEWSCQALHWWRCLTLSSGNNEKALHQRFSFSLRFTSHAHSFVLSWDDRKISQVALRGQRWAFVKRLWAGLVFPQIFRGLPSPLSAVKRYHYAADGRLCLAAACILGAYCCPQRWGCQGRMLPRVQENIFRIISEQ